MNYYTRINRVVSGPISEEDLLEQIRAKSISMLDEVSADGINWRRLGTMPIYNGVTSAPRQVRGAVAEPEPEVRASGTYHLYCEKCGHEWYSNHWDNYCPKSGCTGRARKYAMPVANGMRAAPPRRNWLLVVAALAVVTVATVAVVCVMHGRRQGGAKGDSQGKAPVPQFGARKFAVVVGVGEMDEKSWGDKNALEAPAQNVKMIRSLLSDRGGFASEDIRVLWNAEATYNAVRQAVKTAAANARDGDTFVFYFSGHGGQWGNKNQTFLCTYDKGPSRGKRIGYTDEDLNEDFDRFPRGVVVSAILQACHSGGVMTALGLESGTQWNPADFAASVTALRESGKGLRDGEIAPIGWITAADAAHSSWGNAQGSFFTKSFTSGMQTGVCDSNGDGRASFTEAWRYAKTQLAKDSDSNSYPMCSNEALCEQISVPVPGTKGHRSEFDAVDDAQTSPAAVSNDAVSRFLSPPESDMVELFAQIRDSSAVTENQKYQQVANGIDCHVVEDDSLNAYAHWKRLPSGARIREICYHSGHARFDRVVGAIASKSWNEGENSENQRAQAMMALISELPKTLRAHRYRITAEMAASLLQSAGIDDADFARPGFPENARKVADGIALSTFSHEMGHHLLGHLDGDWHSSTNKVFSRAQEEQADLFSMQVMATAATREDRQQIFMGRFLWCFIVASTDRGDSDENQSHPAMRRRLRSLIEADPATAREFGLNTDMIDKMLAMVAVIQGDAANAASTAP